MVVVCSVPLLRITLLWWLGRCSSVGLDAGAWQVLGLGDGVHDAAARRVPLTRPLLLSTMSCPNIWLLLPGREKLTLKLVWSIQISFRGFRTLAGPAVPHDRHVVGGDKHPT
jgi:hypothetical protein